MVLANCSCKALWEAFPALSVTVKQLLAQPVAGYPALSTLRSLNLLPSAQVAPVGPGEAAAGEGSSAAALRSSPSCGCRSRSRGKERRGAVPVSVPGALSQLLQRPHCHWLPAL